MALDDIDRVLTNTLSLLSNIDRVLKNVFQLKSRSGRRQDDRRILEEGGPAGVALMSLDHAPLPAFRLPRSRRQYMHAPHRHHRHEHTTSLTHTARHIPHLYGNVTL